jgi:Kef-type K+ transport system membrane component KefB
LYALGRADGSWSYVTNSSGFILSGVSRLGAWLLRKVEDDENAYFIVTLAVLIAAGYIADRINLPAIVGAFLAGLAVDGAAQSEPLVSAQRIEMC